MSSPSKDMPHSFLAELLRLLEKPAPDDSGAPALSLEHQIQAGLTWLRDQDHPECARLADLLAILATRLVQDRLPTRIALQKAQFEVQLLRQHQAEIARDPRLRGEAHALGVLLARAMSDLPSAARKKVFSTTEYLAQNPDVADAGLDPLSHYLSSGAEEGRPPRRLAEVSPHSYPDTPYRSLSTLAVSDAPPRFSADLPDDLRREVLNLLGQHRPTISVILPTWNRAHTVLISVSSALLQSFAPQEVIVIDDGSTDGTAELLKARFPEPLADGRLVLLQQAQAGVSAARNAGLARAGGEIIAYLDSDNQWESDHLLFGAAGLLTGPRAQSIYTALCRHNMNDGWSDVLFRRFDPGALAQENYIDLNSFLHRRALYDRLGGFDTKLTRLVDWDLILRYTAESPPVALPVITGHHIVDKEGLGNITLRERAAPNLALIRAKQQVAGEPPR